MTTVTRTALIALVALMIGTGLSLGIAGMNQASAAVPEEAAVRIKIMSTCSIGPVDLVPGNGDGSVNRFRITVKNISDTRIKGMLWNAVAQEAAPGLYSKVRLISLPAGSTFTFEVLRLNLNDHQFWIRVSLPALGQDLFDGEHPHATKRIANLHDVSVCYDGSL